MLIKILTVCGIAALTAGAVNAAATKAVAAAFDLAVPATDKPPKIDGVLDDKIWEQAARLESFTQYEPKEGAVPSERTIGFVAYDRDSFYLAFRCFDSDPEAVRACLTQRDQSRGDDGIRIFLDTFNDKKRAFVFEINPCGIQNDGVFTDARRMGRGGGGGGGGGGGFEMYDKNWDTYFQADARLDAEGYTVEIAIPFKSIRFPNTPLQTWGFQVQRTIRRKSEEIFWSPRSRSVNGFLAQAGVLRFAGEILKGKNLEVMPVTTASRAGDGRFEPQAGLNMKYGITSDLTADMTINPDFSQIEADIPQIDVNQRYPLYYQEKRPFFLEGKDFFDTPFELVYTRRIVAPEFGLKLTGKMGRTTVGFLTTLDGNPPFIEFPGAPVDILTTERNRSWTSVFRLRHDLMSESHIGAVYTDKEMGPGLNTIFSSHNRVAGIDGQFKFADYYRFAFQVAGSQSRAGAGNTAVVPAFSFNLSRQSRHLTASVDWNSLPPDFEASTGFLRRKDIRSLSARVGYAFLPQTPFLVSATPSVEYRRITDFKNTLTDEEVSATFFLTGWRQTVLFANVTTGLERYNGVDFRGTDARLSLTTEPFGWLSVNLNARFGDGLYYSESPYQGWNQSLGLRLTLRPLTNLRFFTNIETSSFFKSKDGERVYSINIISQRLTWQLAKPLSARLIIDWNDYYNKLYLSLLLSYELRPGTVFYLGIDDSQEQDEKGIFRGQGRYYFLKFSYWWRL